jgi:hypothetical protein
MVYSATPLIAREDFIEKGFMLNARKLQDDKGCATNTSKVECIPCSTQTLIH